MGAMMSRNRKKVTFYAHDRNSHRNENRLCLKTAYPWHFPAFLLPFQPPSNSGILVAGWRRSAPETQRIGDVGRAGLETQSGRKHCVIHVPIHALSLLPVDCDWLIDWLQDASGPYMNAPVQVILAHCFSWHLNAAKAVKPTQSDGGSLPAPCHYKGFV